jgi:hypothetical protein
MSDAARIRLLRAVAWLEQHSRVVRETVHDYEWVHTLIGLFGNLAFFVGSVFFFWEAWKTLGIWLFVVGSFAMLLGSLGSGLVRWERQVRRRQDSAGAGTVRAR